MEKILKKSKKWITEVFEENKNFFIMWLKQKIKLNLHILKSFLVLISYAWMSLEWGQKILLR